MSATDLPHDDEPQEGDYTTEDHRHFRQDGRLVLTIAAGDDFRAALCRHMDREWFWPAVWFLSDHGNAHSITLHD